MGQTASEAGSIAQKLANNAHTFTKHATEFANIGITTRTALANRIEAVVLNGEEKSLLNGRTAWWDNGTVVIRDPNTLDGGTAFIPKSGYQYFTGLK